MRDDNLIKIVGARGEFLVFAIVEWFLRFCVASVVFLSTSGR